MEQRQREAREKEEEIESERGNKMVKGRNRRAGREGENQGVLAHLGKQ